MFQPRAVVVDQIEMERWSPLRQAQGRLFCLCGLRPTRRKDNAATVGMEKRGEVGGAVSGHLLFAGPVGVHDEQFQIPRLHQIPAQQLLIDFTFLRRFGMLRPVHDAFAVRGVERPAVVPDVMGEPLEAGSVDIHRIQVDIAVPHRRKHNFLTIG